MKKVGVKYWVSIVKVMLLKICKMLRFLGRWLLCKDTPVLVANTNYHNTSINPFRNNRKALMVAAAMPIVAVPIQEVQLLEYAVAHETVNAGYGLTASTDDVYLGLLDKDPYTSDQQRERDEYEINDTDWNEVVFEEVNGSSTAKLALHNDWLNQKGYQVDAVVEMNLPEQGISGPFKIISIKHIIPQKKPVDEDESDEYDYRPVTALFTHESNQVYNISFDNGEKLGVTYQHPIYSVTSGDWKLAGELEIGEEVLTKSGNTKIVSSAKKEGSETVYNLEVKDLHNFLVSESGVLVHNSCWDIAAEFASGQRNISDIWNMTSFPQIFNRGNILEQISRLKLFKVGDGWKYTGVGRHASDLGKTNYWLIDFFKGDKVVSLKSTNVTDGASWASQNKNHIIDLNEQLKLKKFPNCKPGPNCQNPSNVVGDPNVFPNTVPINKAELHIVVEKLSNINQATWREKILKKITDEGFTVDPNFKIEFSQL